METIYDKYISEIKNEFNKNELSQYGQHIEAELMGDIGVDISVSLYISNMKNFSKALTKLSNEDDSPLSDDGYTGIEIYSPNYTGNTNFIIDTSFLIDNKQNYKTFIESLLKYEVNQSDIDFVFKKCLALSELGFSNINLVDSFYHQEWNEKKQEEN